jgi:hypothetical protein
LNRSLRRLTKGKIETKPNARLTIAPLDIVMRKPVIVSVEMPNQTSVIRLVLEKIKAVATGRTGRIMLAR